MCLSVNPCLMFLMVRWNDEVSSCLQARSVIVFLRLKAVQGVSPAWLYSEEPRTESSGLAPNDPAVKHRDISISVGATTCQQKADGKMKGIRRERLSDYFKFIRVTEGGRTPTRGVLLWGFLSNFKLHSTFNSLSVCPVVCLFVFLHTSVCLHQPVCLSLCLVVNLQPCSLAICVWICSHTANPSAHRWCWHLLWDPGRWQGAQSLPEGQGAAGDQAPQSHGEGEFSPRKGTKIRFLLLNVQYKCMEYINTSLLENIARCRIFWLWFWSILPKPAVLAAAF